MCSFAYITGNDDSNDDDDDHHHGHDDVADVADEMMLMLSL